MLCSVRKYISIFGLILYLIVVFKPAIPAFSYFLNQDFFAKERCVNTSKPELRCKGKCQMKKMAEENSEKSENSNPSISSIESIQISTIPKRLEITCFASNGQIFATTSTDKYQFDFSDSCWHPPSFELKA